MSFEEQSYVHWRITTSSQRWKCKRKNQPNVLKLMLLKSCLALVLQRLKNKNLLTFSAGKTLRIYSRWSPSVWVWWFSNSLVRLVIQSIRSWCGLVSSLNINYPKCSDKRTFYRTKLLCSSSVAKVVSVNSSANIQWCAIESRIRVKWLSQLKGHSAKKIRRK